MKHLAWLSSMLCLGLTTGCPGPSTVPLEEVPSRLAPAYCGLIEGCGNPFVGPFIFGTEPCATGVVPFLEDSFVARGEAALAMGTVIYHGELIDSCIASIEGAGCSINSLAGGACTEVFEGTVPAGGDCEWDEECVEGYCSLEGGMCPGTCAARAVGGVGATCTQDAGCDPGLTCSAGMCAERSGAGEPCGGSAALQCSGIDLNCVTPAGATEGICRPWSSILDGAIGETCMISDDLCDPGLSCVFVSAGAGGATFECAARFGPGEDCRTGFPNPCPDDQFCMMGATGGMGVCTALPDEGEPCMSSQCSPGLRCETTTPGMGTCVAPGRLGTACTSDTACASSTCRDGVCATPGC